MSQEPKNPLISVHETADPRDISPNTDGKQECDRRDRDNNVDLNEENFDALSPEPANTNEEKLGSQNAIANISAGQYFYFVCTCQEKLSRCQ